MLEQKKAGLVWDQRSWMWDSGGQKRKPHRRSRLQHGFKSCGVVGTARIYCLPCTTSQRSWARWGSEETSTVMGSDLGCPPGSPPSLLDFELNSHQIWRLQCLPVRQELPAWRPFLLWHLHVVCGEGSGCMCFQETLGKTNLIDNGQKPISSCSTWVRGGLRRTQSF